MATEPAGERKIKWAGNGTHMGRRDMPWGGKVTKASMDELGHHASRVRDDTQTVPTYEHDPEPSGDGWI